VLLSPAPLVRGFDDRGRGRAVTWVGWVKGKGHVMMAPWIGHVMSLEKG
jgi:hypothetical protein